MTYYFIKLKEDRLIKLVDLLVKLEPHFEIELEEVGRQLKITLTEPEMRPCEWSNLLAFHKCKEPDLLEFLSQLAPCTHDAKVINETSGVSRSWFELQLTEFIEHCQIDNEFSSMRFEFTLDLFEIKANPKGRLCHQSPVYFS